VSHPRQKLALLLVVAAAIAVPAANAKELGPGDLRICGAERCVSITDPIALRAISSFMYHGPPSTVVRAPRLGSDSLELRFDNDYVTGVVASARLDRFLSYGVNIGHFARGRWYRLPDRAARELTRLTSPLAWLADDRPASVFDLFVRAALAVTASRLEPVPLTRAALRRSR
jgi:hypothetical protein